MQKKGYVIYNMDSELYPTKLIEENPNMNTLDIVFRHIRNNYTLFSKYKDLQFRGPLEEEINKVMQVLFHPRREQITTGMYIFPTFDTVDIRETIPVIRNIYSLQKVKNGVYQQKDILKSTSGQDLLEMYHVYTNGDINLYQGKMGSFYLSDDPDMEIRKIDVVKK